MLLNLNGRNERYTAYTYNVHLFPVSFGPLDTRFLAQASSLEFLCKHNFDFNKLLYEGVSYMNETQEGLLQAHLLEDPECDSNKDIMAAEAIQNKCSLVTEWLAQKKEESLVIHTDHDERDLSDYTLQQELRRRFPTIWTTTSEFGEIVVEKIDEEKRLLLEQESKHAESARKDRVMNDMLGFTLVFRMLVKYRKPLLGHNMLLDLLYLYEKFHKPLPDSYETFKSELHNLFPVIFDTKHISYNLRQLLKATGLLETTNLGCLFDIFNSAKGKYHVLGTPDIVHADRHDRYVDVKRLHEAGYDAFQCGCVFLRLAHIIKFKGVSVAEIQPCRFREYLHVMKPFANLINIARASIAYLNLGDGDPVCNRPDYLFVQSMTKTPLNLSFLAGLFSSYGTVDIKIQGRHKAIVATTNFRCFRDILRNFKGNKEISVVRYNKLKHHPAIRIILCVGVLTCAVVCTWAITSKST